MAEYKVLLTCPPMIGRIDEYREKLSEYNMDITIPDFTQVLSVKELIDLVPQFDAWIIGDDPATEAVFKAGKEGRLKAAMKWGVGTDNVDFDACNKYNIPVSNTPGMFNNEVADVAVGYVIALAREFMAIDRKVRQGGWYKPCGMSLTDKKVALIGFGNIGRCIAHRLLAFGLKIHAVDPFFRKENGRITCDADIEFSESIHAVDISDLQTATSNCDFIVVCCALTPSSHHSINKSVMMNAKPGVKIVNVGRGPIINQSDLVELMHSGYVSGAALDVFEVEPLPQDDELRQFENTVFGAHNCSNTKEAVDRTSFLVIDKLKKYLDEDKSD
ncbi:unnamed protein product [Owenia fusiformis]|uniref:Phosphoglycerate dehydrogenase n=1 Tax=Owenia fusiformis TaxID=6347 RepID=A0A8S4NPW2_OWEFU|nr:unnamed protein product [Owenia fusiformis]